MKRILLISNYGHHYRLKIYNYFAERFKSIGYEFVMLTDGVDKVEFDLNFRIIVLKQSVEKYFEVINSEKPEVVITFLHIKDIVNYPVSLFCRLKRIPLVIWIKGINIKTRSNFVKNQLFYLLHDLANGIVIYTPNELKDISSRNRQKVNFGFNTLSFEGIDKSKVKGIEYVREKYGIKQERYVLFAATIKDDKKLDELLNTPLKDEKMAVVIAGKGIKDSQLKKIALLDNYYYIGQIPYDDYEMNALFKSCKFFTSPGDLGLAAVQALYWGKPVFVLDVHHSVEIYYLKHELNGFIAKDMNQFWLKIKELDEDHIQYKKYVSGCNEVFQSQAHVSVMFNGFLNVVQMVTNK